MATTLSSSPPPAVKTPAGIDSARWLGALSAEANKLRAAQPALSDRADAAFHLATSGAVSQNAEGRWQVESRTTPGVYWRLDGSCGCPDAASKAPGGLCAHRLAVGLTRRALTHLQKPAADDPCAAPIPEERETSAATVPALPEAAFSLCLRGALAGQDAQLTVRGQTYAEFAAHVAQVRGLLDAVAAPPEHTQGAAGPPSPQEIPTCPTHGPMKPSTKIPGSYYCTKKLYNGSYCQSRHP